MQVLQSFVEDNLLAVSICLGVVVLLVLLIIVVAAISGHKSKKYEEIPEGSASNPGDTDDDDDEDNESTSDQSPDNESVDDAVDDDEDIDDIEVEEIDEAIPEQSEKKSDIEVNSNQSHRKSKTTDEDAVADGSEQDQDKIEENEEDETDDDDEDNTYVIEKSAQAHAKRHEKREWQHESDQDKFDKKAYSQGVNFKYVPNKESMNKYRDMVESEDLSKKSKEEDEKALNEIREKEKEAELAAKAEDTFKQDTTALLEKMSKRIDELAATVNDAPASLSSDDLEKQMEKLLVSFKAQEEKNSNHSKAVSYEISTRFKNGQNSIAQLSDDIASRQNDVMKAVDALKVGIQSVMVKEDNDYSEDFEKVQKEVDSLRTTIAGVNDMVYRSIVAIGNNAKKIEDSQKDVSSILDKLNALDEKVSNINVPTETEVTLNDESFLRRHNELLDKLDAIINKQEENANAVSSSFKGTQTLSQRHGNELEKIMDAVKAISVPVIIKQSEQNFEAVPEEKVVESDAQDDAEDVHVEESEPVIEQEVDELPVEEAEAEDSVEAIEVVDDAEQTEETEPAEEIIEAPVEEEVESADEPIDDVESKPDPESQEVVEEIVKENEVDDSAPEQVRPASSEDETVVERSDSDENVPVESGEENAPLYVVADDISEKNDVNSPEDAVVSDVEPEEREIQEVPAMEESPKEETVEKEANTQPEEAKPAEQVVPAKEPVKEETNKTSTQPPHNSQPKQTQGSAPEKKKEDQSNSSKTSQQAPAKTKKPVAKQIPKQAPKKGSNAKTGKGSGQAQKKPANGNNGSKKTPKQSPNKKPQQRGMGITKEERLKQLQQKEAEKQKQIDETISRAPIRVVSMSASNSSKMSKEEIAEFRKRGKERFERIQAKRKALEEAQAKESGQAQDNASAKTHNSGAIKAQVKPPVKAKASKQEVKPEADANISSTQINAQKPTNDKAYDSAVKAEEAMSYDLDVALGLTGSTSELDENLTGILSEAPETNISSTVEESVGFDGEVMRGSEEYSDNAQEQVSTAEVEANSSQSVGSGVASRVDYAEEAVSNAGETSVQKSEKIAVGNSEEASVQESASNAGYDSESASESVSRHGSESMTVSNSRHNSEQVVEAQTRQHQSQAYMRQGFRRRDSEVVQEEEKATVRPLNRSMRPTRPTRPTTSQTSSRPTRPTRPTRARR